MDFSGAVAIPFSIAAEFSSRFTDPFTKGSLGSRVRAELTEGFWRAVLSVVDISIAIFVDSVANFGFRRGIGLTEFFAIGAALISSLLTVSLFFWIGTGFSDEGGVIDFSVAVIIDFIVADFILR